MTKKYLSDSSNYHNMINNWHRFAKRVRFIMDHGGKCKHCNKNLLDSPYDSEFHHADSENKDGEISRIIRSRSYEKAKIEVDKCILLCTACHRKVHFKWKDWELYKDEVIEIAKSVHKNKSCQKTKIQLKKVREEIKKHIESGKSYSQISKILNIPKSTIAYNVDYMNLESSHKTQSNVKAPEKEVQRLKKEGYTRKEVADILNCDPSNVSRKWH